MSEIKVNSIKGVGASTAAITVNNTDGTCTANLTNRTNKNLVVNGACLIAQRGTSDSSSSGGFTCDRFGVYPSGLDEAPTQAQVDVASGTTPYTLGFRKALKITNGNQTSGAGADDNLRILYKVEAQDIANSGWNYLSSSSYITLSFWVKSSVAQNFYVQFRTKDGTEQNYTIETGSLSADTWTKVTKTIPGNSNLTFNNDNGVGTEINFWQFAGTNLTGSMTLDQWAAYSGSARMPDMTSTWYTTNDATFEITGVQLEVSDHATSFEHRSFAVEKRLCMRYYQQYTNMMIVGYAPDNSNRSYAHAFTFPVEMRSAPTLTISNTGSVAGQYVTDGEFTKNVTSLLSAACQTTFAEISLNLSGDLVNYRGAYTIDNTSTSRQTTYYFTAEL